MNRTMLPGYMMPGKTGQIINSERQKKKAIMKTMGLKTGKAYRRYMKDERRKAKGN
jgi:hypothetical protein